MLSLFLCRLEFKNPSHSSNKAEALSYHKAGLTTINQSIANNRTM